MKALALLLGSLACVGCAVTQERAIAVARRELADRKLTLPGEHTVTVYEAVGALEKAPWTYKLWDVEFHVPGRKKPLYQVWVERRFGTVDDFTDDRMSTKRETAL